VATLSLLRRLTAGAVVAFAAHAASAGAQLVTAAYAPSCGPGTPCGSVRFTLTNVSATTMKFDALTLTSAGAPFIFSSAGGAVATYEAVDVSGPFGGVGTLNAARTSFSINFLDTGLPFELTPGFGGYVELQLAGAPALPALPGSGAFQFTALPTGSNTPITGAVVTTPEPATFVLLGSGLALVALGRRRRRVA